MKTYFLIIRKNNNIIREVLQPENTITHILNACEDIESAGNSETIKHHTHTKDKQI
jgi:hypothetical protein